MKQHKHIIIVSVCVALVLALAFWYGGDAPGLRTNSQGASQQLQTATPISEVVKATATPQAEVDPPQPTPTVAASGEKPQKADGSPMTAAEKVALAQSIADRQTTEAQEDISGQAEEPSGTEQQQTTADIKAHPTPTETDDTPISDVEQSCTLSVRCDTILQHLDWLDTAKRELVPQSGVIFPETTVVFYEGESVFHVLAREMKRHKIHLEFENTPLYRSAYIEGIANLYEFDCGELSGWMYKVNGWFPNYGCSRYRLEPGDRIEWVYTCDLGADVGGHTSTRNGR